LAGNLRDIHDQQFILFANGPSNCFLASAVNFLHAIHPIVTWICRTDPSAFDSILLVLRELFTQQDRQLVDLTHLRQELSAQYQEDNAANLQQHDAFEAFTYILHESAIPQNVLNVLQYTSINQSQCSCGWEHSSSFDGIVLVCFLY